MCRMADFCARKFFCRRRRHCNFSDSHKMAQTIANLTDISFLIASTGGDQYIATIPISKISFSANGDAHVKCRSGNFFTNMFDSFGATGLVQLPNIANNTTVNNVIIHNSSNSSTAVVPVNDAAFYSGSSSAKSLGIKVSVVMDRLVTLSSATDANSGTYTLSSGAHLVFGSSYYNSITPTPSFAMNANPTSLVSSISGPRLDL